jgi:hypothetical protein
MGAFKRLMGLDIVDCGIHVVVTGFLAGIADVAAVTNEEGFVMLIMAASTVLFGVRRHHALRRAKQFPESTGEVAAMRVEELEMRMAELEQGQMRMQELEDRLDFAERMLLQQREVRQLSSREEP